ncbi:hypothetical protein TNCV_3470551 [Trichonephila clavipes]|nr:hypothetical protein TNCV_3470551 [Trichonephila clavipes]
MPQNSLRQKARILRLSLALTTMQVTVRFFSVPPQFRGRKSWEWSGTSHHSSTNHTRERAARRLFRVPPCRKGSIHLQTSMSSPGFEPSPYGIAVSVANHYTGWATMPAYHTDFPIGLSFLVFFYE